MTFAAGVLLLLGWLYATIDNARSGTLIKKALLFFVLPFLFSPGLQLVRLPFGIWLAAGYEEGVKAFASTRERSPQDKFWLVALFGIFELMVDKPFWGLFLARSGESWDRLSMAGLVYAAALPALMHTVTAAIYAFAFRQRLWASFLASWVIHSVFNETAAHFERSLDLAFVQTILLGTLLGALVMREREQLRPANN